MTESALYSSPVLLSGENPSELEYHCTYDITFFS